MADVHSSNFNKFDSNYYNQQLNPNNIDDNYALNKDPERGILIEEDIQVQMRLGFVRKVYSILAVQLFITVSLICVSFIPKVNFYLRTNLTLFYVSLGLSVILFFTLICFKTVARKVPLNYILLFTWTLLESYMLATCASLFDQYAVITAMGMTVIVTLALTIYALTTKVNFYWCSSLIFAISGIMIGYIIFALVFRIYLDALYCALGVTLYSIYLIYDTQLIIGKFRIAYSIDDYIFAVMSIYIDIIQIFLFILRIFGGRK